MDRAVRLALFTLLLASLSTLALATSGTPAHGKQKRHLEDIQGFVTGSASKPTRSVLVLQVSSQLPSDDQDTLYDYSTLYNHLWCQYHGYRYKRVVDDRHHHLHETWLKVLHLGRYLADYDLVVLLDFDAKFVSFKTPLEDLLAGWGFVSDTHLILACEDPADPEVNGSTLPDGTQVINVNTGFMVFRGKNKKLQQLVELWGACVDEVPGCAEWRHKVFHEQTAFNMYIRPQLTGEEFLALPCNEANGYPDIEGCRGKHVQHFWGNKDLAKNVMRDELRQLWKDAAFNILVADGSIVRTTLPVVERLH